MKLDTLLTYIEQCAHDGLTKMTIEIDSTGDYDGVFYVTKTKETYSYDSESKSDAKVDEVKDNPGFTGVDKKFKAGKVNKAGEIVRADEYQVIAKIAH